MCVSFECAYHYKTPYIYEQLLLGHPWSEIPQDIYILFLDG
jgi:hypothetical protein